MLTAFMNSIETLNRYGVPYRIFINSDAEIVVRYNEYGQDYTDEVFDSIGNLIRTKEVYSNATCN